MRGKERRWFLKTAAFATTAVFVESTVRPLGKLAHWLDSQIPLPEGNLAEKYAVFSRIVQDINLNPRNPVPRKQLKSWLLFNAAHQYAKINKFYVSSLTSGHFLSATGYPLNITDDFFTSYYQFSQGKLPNPTRSETYRHYFIWAYHQSLNKQGASLDYFRPTGHILRSSIKNGSLKEIHYGGVTDSPNKDIAFGMGNSVLNFSGNINSIIYNDERKLWQLKLSDVHFDVSDLYDWDPNKPLYAAPPITPNWVLEKLLAAFQVRNPKVFLIDLLGKDIAHLLSQPLISVTQEDGVVLQESPYAKPYNIFTKRISIEKPVDITIPESVLD